MTVLKFPHGKKKMHQQPLGSPSNAFSDIEEPEQAFKHFGATELYCPKCKRAMPVRERLLLVLPSGSLYDYICSQCHTSLGTRKTG